MRISNFEVRISNSETSRSVRWSIRNSKFEIRTSAIVALATVAVLFACGPSTITRDKWQHMSNDDKAIYVSSMIGGEKAKQQKGGTGRMYSAGVQHYVTQIDAAYAQGDQRDVAAIFSEMADRK